MPEEMDLIKLNTIKRYIRDIIKMKASKTAYKDIQVRFNMLIKKVIRESAKETKEEDRSVIMPRDVDPVLERVLGSKNLTEAELFKQIKRLSVIQIGSLAKRIDEYIEEEKNK